MVFFKFLFVCDFIKDLQVLEKKRIDTFKEFVVDCVKVEGEVLPRIKQCLTEIDNVARSINSDQVGKQFEFLMII